MSQQQWFDVDRAGLGKQAEGHGKGRLIGELVQNALDEEGVRQIAVTLALAPGRPLADLTVEDDAPEGFSDDRYSDEAIKHLIRLRFASAPWSRGQGCCRDRGRRDAVFEPLEPRAVPPGRRSPGCAGKAAPSPEGEAFAVPGAKHGPWPICKAVGSGSLTAR